MRHISTYLLTATIAVGCVMNASAMPAKQGLLTVPTSDGSTLQVRLVGDEHFHQYYTEDGYPLAEEGGDYYYCDIDAEGNLIKSGILATAPATRGAEAREFLKKVELQGIEKRVATRSLRSPRLQAKPLSQRRAMTRGTSIEEGPVYEKGYGLFPGYTFPGYGHQKAIVILVEYQDVKFNETYQNGATPIDYFTRMLNEEGFSDFGGTGSAAEYFSLNSDGTFLPEFDVYGPITLSKSMSYYGQNDHYGDDKNPAAMVKEACDALDSTVDFSEFDRDGDGYVDNVFLFYAGKGESSGGGANTVWPHAWYMETAGYSKAETTYDGVIVNSYGCTNEWEGGRPDGVGTFIHEFSHVIGLPDLYSTSYSTAFTPGTWSALDYGPYNNDGMTPPLYGAFERYALGWIKPNEVTEALSAKLEPISQNVCGIIRTESPTEFFLLENRQQEGWDAYVPGHGMLVWHIDYNENIWQQNTVNNSSYHQYCDIVEADGTTGEGSRAGDAFPGTMNKTSFTSSTNPAMKTWAGKGLDYPITNIAEQDGIITFDVLGGAEAREIPTPSAAIATEVADDGFSVRWTPRAGFETLLCIYPTSANARVTAAPHDFLPGFHNRNVGSSAEMTLSGLETDTEYAIEVAYTTGWETSAFSEPLKIRTDDGSSVVMVTDDSWGNADSLVKVDTANGIACGPEGVNLRVYDSTGVLMASGTGTVMIPTKGLFIITAPEVGYTRKFNR